MNKTEKFPLVVFGSAEIAKLAKYYFDNDSEYNIVAFTVDDDYVEGKDEVKVLKGIPKDSKYINRLKDYFVESRFVGDKVRKFICSVYELCCGNLDSLARKGKYKNGYPVPVVKNILNGGNLPAGMYQYAYRLKIFVFHRILK